MKREADADKTEGFPWGQVYPSRKKIFTYMLVDWNVRCTFNGR